MEKAKLAVGTWIRLMKSYNLILRRTRRRIKECTLSQFDVLAQLERHPEGVTFSELSKELLVTAGNLTGVVDRLEKSGLVVRSSVPTDRRSVLLRLTEKGDTLAKRLIARHRRDLKFVFSVLTEEELVQLRNLLDKLQQALEEEK
ncbi:MAG: MarR family transcriptional regulator [Acidobacteriota bacterium]|nr:MarR family transcriptional regulator [Blastocatellia bacterium]MDW8413658.1 MarR family transcriptional regulator [Acidobacteriota bacterium]